MGKRKSSKPPPKKIVQKLPKHFDCPFCDHSQTVDCTLERDLGKGTAKCRVCNAFFQTPIHGLSQSKKDEEYSKLELLHQESINRFNNELEKRSKEVIALRDIINVDSNGNPWGDLSLKPTDGSPIPFNPLHFDLMKNGLPSNHNLWFYDSYITSTNWERKIPNWVIQRITAEDMKHKRADRKGVYFNNNTIQVPVMFRANNRDYIGSGWSRGHMIPAGDNISSQEAMNQTFLLNSNIVPQDFENNSNFWYRLEVFCKSVLTQRYKGVIVISGPLFLPNLVEPLSPEELLNTKRYSRVKERRYVKYEVIGKNNVAVPTHLYKVILAEPWEDGNNDGATPAPQFLGSFVIPNEPIPSDKVLTDYEVPLHFIQESTGLEFFKKLDYSKDIKPLCENPMDCLMMTEKQLEIHNIPRRISWSKDQSELDLVLNEIKEKNITVGKYRIIN
eukprot:gene11167-13683_t